MICDNFKVELPPRKETSYKAPHVFEDSSSVDKNLMIEKTDDYVSFGLYWDDEFYGTRFLFANQGLEEFFYFENNGDVVEDKRSLSDIQEIKEAKKYMRDKILDVLVLNKFDYSKEVTNIKKKKFLSYIDQISDYLKQNGI